MSQTLKEKKSPQGDALSALADVDPGQLGAAPDTSENGPMLPPIVYQIIATTFVANARKDPNRTARLVNAVKRASECGGDVNRAAIDLFEADPETAKLAREYGLTNTGDCNIQLSIAGGILIGLAIGFAFGVVVGAAVSN